MKFKKNFNFDFVYQGKEFGWMIEVFVIKCDSGI